MLSAKKLPQAFKADLRVSEVYLELFNVVQSKSFMVLFGVNEGDCIFIQFYENGSFKYITDYRLKSDYFNGRIVLSSRKWHI